YLFSDSTGTLHGFAGLAWINIGCSLLACGGVWLLLKGLAQTRNNNNPASGTARQGSQ
ncbi:MFS transporter, partial [Escherichia coli]